MNASSWRKAVDLVAQGTQANQQVQAAATADSSQLVHQGQAQPLHEKYKPLIHTVR